MTMMAPGTFSALPLEALLDHRLTLQELRVLSALFSFRDTDTDLCWPTRESVGARCGYPVGTVSNVTARLVEKGWIMRERRTFNGPNVWRLFLSPQVDDERERVEAAAALGEHPHEPRDDNAHESRDTDHAHGTRELHPHGTRDTKKSGNKPEEIHTQDAGAREASIGGSVIVAGEYFCPDGWEPDPAILRMCRPQPGVDRDFELMQFRLHGFRSPTNDWSRRFAKWLNAAKPRNVASIEDARLERQRANIAAFLANEGTS